MQHNTAMAPVAKILLQDIVKLAVKSIKIHFDSYNFSIEECLHCCPFFYGHFKSFRAFDIETFQDGRNVFYAKL